MDNSKPVSGFGAGTPLSEGDYGTKRVLCAAISGAGTPLSEGDYGTEQKRMTKVKGAGTPLSEGDYGLLKN